MKYLAQLINEWHTSNEGYSYAVKWDCLDESLQRKYLIQAYFLVFAIIGVLTLSLTIL